MTDHPMFAAAVLVWLVGAVVGWCVGWAARGEQNRAWHSGLMRQLAHTRAQLDQTLDQLDQAHDELDNTPTWAQRIPPPPAPAVHVHVDTALPSWLAPHPAPPHTPRLSNPMPVLPAEEVP